MIAITAESDNLKFPEGEIDLQVTATTVLVLRVRTTGETVMDFIRLWKKALKHAEAVYPDHEILVAVERDASELKALFDRMSKMEYQFSIYRLDP